MIRNAKKSRSILDKSGIFIVYLSLIRRSIMVWCCSQFYLGSDKEAKVPRKKEEIYLSICIKNPEFIKIKLCPFANAFAHCFTFADSDSSKVLSLNTCCSTTRQTSFVTLHCGLVLNNFSSLFTFFSK